MPPVVRRFAAWLVVFAPLVAACSSGPYVVASHEAGTPPPDSARTYRVFLLGDGGDARAGAPVLRMLRRHLADTGADGAVVFLGDNAYPSGLPPEGAPTREDAEASLRAQLDAVADFPGRVVFVPGNHDWGAAGDVEALARQEAYVEAYLGRGDAFLPDDGAPGPAVVELNDEVTLLALDTQYWLPRHGGAFTGPRNEPPGGLGEVVVALEEALYEHRKRHLLVVGHHPLFSNGKHGGRVALRDHLVPLPFVGSLGPIYRRFVGKDQDLAGEDYRVFRREMLRLFDGRDGLVYAAGHDHNLQHFARRGARGAQHYLVSGAASKVDYVAGGDGAAFTAAALGFLTLGYYRDGSVWLEAWTPEGDGPGRCLYRARLHAPAADLTPPPDAVLPDYRDSTVVRAVAPRYDDAGALRRFLVGDGYRDLWGMPVEVPVLDLARDAGGLVPLEIGGQSQSVTLRMQGGDGKIYMLRSIDKVAGRAWSDGLRASPAGDLVQDQISMLHPFGALLAARLADAAGVYHTNPRLVFVPDDPRLGEAREALGGQVVQFEERPDEDMSDVASMGFAGNVIGTTKLLQEVGGDNDHRVDARAFARARLLDMLIADHDRTGDNFRWAAFEPWERDPSLEGEARTKGKVYVPVPWDRDMAFLSVDGLVPRLYRFVAEPHWQDFDASYGLLRGLNGKGFALDRRFAAGLTRDDWVALADDIVRALDDDALRAAVRAWPEPVRRAGGDAAVETLRARRDRLPEVAEAYYELLAEVVDVVGSDKHERFEVTRRPDGSTEVVMFKTEKDGAVEHELLRRTLVPGETDELRLYGLGGDDAFVVRGATGEGIVVRAVGGTGDDRFDDASDVRGRGPLTRFYDTRAGTTAETSDETRTDFGPDPRLNRYELDGHRPASAAPIGYFGANDDDGVFVGAGVRITRHSFRRTPYAVEHRVMGNVAAATRAFNVRYLGRFVGRAERPDLEVEVGLYSPNSIRNYYGLGNETPADDRAARYYQARLTRGVVRPWLAFTPRPGVRLRAGPALEYFHVREDADRFVGQPQAGLSMDAFGRKLYGGAHLGIEAAALDDASNPRQGFRLEGGVDARVGLHRAAAPYATVAGAMTLYHGLSLMPQVTLATRVGGAHNVGTFPFYAANTLGSGENLRGYRTTRFAGRTSVYGNADLRVGLARVQNYALVGVYGFADAGRVWTDGERSRVWHAGYGGGAWVHIADLTTLTASYALSSGDRAFTVRFGFLF